MQPKYVWLNIETGEFSSSWSEDVPPSLQEELIAQAKPTWKLIKYECLNVPEFEFTKHMKIR